MRKCDGILACSRNDQDLWFPNFHLLNPPQPGSQACGAKISHSQPSQSTLPRFHIEMSGLCQDIGDIDDIGDIGQQKQSHFRSLPLIRWSRSSRSCSCISLLHLNWRSLASATEVRNAEWVDTFFAPWGNLCGWSQALQHNGCVRCELVSKLQAQWLAHRSRLI